jgi:transcriptional regulator with XRE-family HTH domain
MVRVFQVFSGNQGIFFEWTMNFHLTIMVHYTKVSLVPVRKLHRGELALALRRLRMATSLVCVETREVVRCEYCRLMQYRTNNSLCRRCHKPLDIEEPEALVPQLVTSHPSEDNTEAGLQVAAQVREMRRARHMSQRQLAGRMQVPRTYISKIENGKAIPTLGSLERLATALEIEVRQLVRDARSRRDEEVVAILDDPFLAEIAPLISSLDSLHRSLFLGAVRDLAAGRRIA